MTRVAFLFYLYDNEQYVLLMLQHLKNRHYFIPIILIAILSSCGSQKHLLYNPSEVIQLSNKLGIELNNKDKEDDKHMYLYAQSSLWIGVPYHYGGTTKKGVDCSGLTYNIYKTVYRKTVPRDTNGLEKKAKKVSKGKLKPGDLVFFATTGDKKKITHVGIYLKNNKFIHASTSRGVIVSDLNESYYRQCWKRGGNL